jgi:hypothetical protein
MKSETALRDHQIGFEAAVAQSPPYPADRFDGRGIVIPAGGARLFTCAWVAIGVLRRVLGCSLPIQVWHLGPAEMGPPMRALLEEQGVEVIDAHEVARRHPVRTLGGWELKPYAIIHSRFREVLLLDADNVPAVDPAWLFDSTEFAETGAIFWPDIVRLKADNPIWEISAVPYSNAPTVESGQLVVDKQRCWRALQLTMHMNEHSDFYYQHLYGDKDTFFIAWHRLRQPYAMTSHPPHRPQLALYQRDFEGRTIFQHRTGAKWVYDGQNPGIPGFRHEEDCLRLLAELQTVWNGRVFRPGTVSPAAARIAAELERTEWFHCRRIGSEEKRIQLLPANGIGEGRSDEEFYWSVEEDVDGPCLVFEGRRRITCRLRWCPDGYWTGRSLGPDRWTIDLHPVQPTNAAPAAGGASTNAAGALLESLIAAQAARPVDPESIRDLIGALRLLAAGQPGFAAAMADRLASEAQADEPIAQCLRAVLAERSLRAPSAPAAPLSGHGHGFVPGNLSSHYDRLN